MPPACITLVTMRVVALLTFLLVNVRLSCCCLGDGSTLFCTSIPAAFPPGFSSLLMSLRINGAINSSVLRSDSLISITRLRIENAGVTRISEGAFSSLQNLTVLSLRQNFLKEVNVNWFGRSDVLRELNLAENQIEVLNESMLNGLTDLRKLRLDKNRIRSIGLGSFSSQMKLDELDLSENRMTRVSPQVFTSLGPTRIRLHGNPWDCSCGAEDFVDFLKDLQNRSLLDRQMEVTCESPPSLRGQPVWNVSVCVTSPPPRPPSTAQTVHPKPSDIPTGASTSSAPARPTSETKTSVQPKPPGTLTTVTTSDLQPTVKPVANETLPPSVTQISVHPKPSDSPTTTPAPSTYETKTSVQPKPPSTLTTVTMSDPPTTTSAPTGVTETSVTSPPSSDVNTVCTLVVVIAVLSSLLFMACFLVVMHWRKRQNKTVTPGCPKDTRDELKDDCSRPSPAQSTQHKAGGDFPEKQHLDSELGWTRSFTGVRAKSADAVLFTSPFCAPVKEQVSLQTETETHSEDPQAEGRQKVGNDSEADGGLETENQTNTTDVRDKYAKRVTDGRNPHKDPKFVSVLADTVPYLSIGTNQNQPSPADLNKQNTGGPDITRDAHKSHMRKVMGRISSWPLTAVQWQARCKMEKEDKDGVSDVFSVWTGEMKRVLHKDEQNSGSDRDGEEGETEKTQTEDPLKMDVVHMSLGHSESSKPKKETTSVRQAHVHTDMDQEDQEEEKIREPASERRASSQSQNLSQEEAAEELKAAEKNISKRRSNKAEQRNEARRAVTSRQRAENRSTASKVPSGGASPDDETLLSGNEYAFMDLLHEVVQNNGRWTRERWKQTHVNKPRR